MELVFENFDQNLADSLYNAIEESNSNLTDLSSKMIKLFTNKSLNFDPDLIVAVLLDFSEHISDEKCIFSSKAEDEDLINFFRTIFIYIPELKNAASDMVGLLIEWLPLDYSKRMKRFVSFYVAALKNGLLFPSKLIWGRNDSWSHQLGTFLGRVLEMMEYSMTPCSILKLFLDYGLIDAITSGSNFIWKLEPYLPDPSGLAIKYFITRTCEKWVVDLLAKLISVGESVDEDDVLRATYNIGIAPSQLPKKIWSAIETIVMNVGTHRPTHQGNVFQCIPRLIDRRPLVKRILQRHAATFLESINFPPCLAHLNANTEIFLERCVHYELIQGSDLADWEQKKKN